MIEYFVVYPLGPASEQCCWEHTDSGISAHFLVRLQLFRGQRARMIRASCVPRNFLLVPSCGNRGTRPGSKELKTHASDQKGINEAYNIWVANLELAASDNTDCKGRDKQGFAAATKLWKPSSWWSGRKEGTMEQDSLKVSGHGCSHHWSSPPRVYFRPQCTKLSVVHLPCTILFLSSGITYFLEPIGSSLQIIVNVHTEYSFKLVIAWTQKLHGMNLRLDELDVFPTLHVFDAGA